MEFLFDLACPFTYLAAERVERAFAEVTWTPADARALPSGAPADPDALARSRRLAEARAVELRLPISWPDRFPAPVPSAMRVASLAAEYGRASAFVLAAGRLAFCGGFDIEEPEILADAAAAAGLEVDDCLAATREPWRDAQIHAAGDRMRAKGAERLPALSVAGSLYCGEQRVGEGVAAWRRAGVTAISGRRSTG